jgi:hypothetical protein
VSSAQVVAYEPNIAFDKLFDNDVAFPCGKLDADVQFGRPTHGSDSASSLATRRVLLHRCFQNEQARNIIRVAITHCGIPV